MKYKFDLHIHTIASGHAYSTIQESVAIAKEKGLEAIGISDHAPAMPGSQYIFYFQNLKVVPNEIDGIRLYKGVEANIINNNGDIDLSSNEMGFLDYVIASMHPPCLNFQTKDINTRTLIKTMKNPYVKIIGHPDDGRYPLDYEEIVKAAKDNNVLLEVNNSSLNPDGFRKNADSIIRKILEFCIKHNHPVLLSSDAHISFSIADFSNCIKILDEISFPEELIVNTSFEKLEKFI